jgi:regulator of sigma E protease
MGTLTMIGQLLLALSILIILHEAGHFFAAKMFGIRVEKFYLFFDAYGKKLFSFTKGGTEYGIGWLPLGGYVKIAGMIDESLDTEQLKSEPQDWEFRSKPAWQRFIVMIGGVTVNLVLGLIISIGILYHYGEKYTPISEIKDGFAFSQEAIDMGFKNGDKIISVNGVQVKYAEKIITPELFTSDNNFITIEREGTQKRIDIPDNLLDILSEKKTKQSFLSPLIRDFYVDSVPAGNPAADAGIKKGDKIVAINNTPTIFFNDLKTTLENNKNKSIDLTVLRASDSLHLKCLVSEEGTIGFMPMFEHEFASEVITYGFMESIPLGIKSGWENLVGQVKAFGKIFSGKVKATNALQGPIGIAKAFGSDWNWFRFWNLTALLSLVLAFMNLLPIPALDGGHVVLIIVEKLRGKPLGDKAMERVQMVGMFIVLGLMIFAFGNDIFKAFFK